MLVAGPALMDLVFGGDFDYDRARARAHLARHGPVPGGGHAQPGAAGARPGARRRARAGLAAAAGFVVFLLLPGFDDRVLQVEVGLRRRRRWCCAGCSTRSYSRGQQPT